MEHGWSMAGAWLDVHIALESETESRPNHKHWAELVCYVPMNIQLNCVSRAHKKCLEETQATQD